MGEVKKIHAVRTSNVQDLVNTLNMFEIKKEDILTIIDKPDGLFVIYEK